MRNAYIVHGPSSTAVKNGRVFGQTLCLLESFAPAAWKEQAYITNPPFVTESSDGSLIVFPLTPDVEHTLDRIRAPLGLKKIPVDRHYFLTSRNDTLRAMGLFNWLVRRSWRDKKRAVLWALVHECRRQGSEKATVSLEALSELTGFEPKACAEAVQGLFGPEGYKNRNGARSNFEVDSAKVYERLEEILEDTPTWTEELLMRTLCSEGGASAPELYDQINQHDFTVGALYKTTERLKRDGYLRTARHVRVNDRGPMRELLSSDCSNCFYGFSNSENCLNDAFRQLEFVLKRYYGKDLTEAQRVDSQNALRSVPSSSRVLRRAVEALAQIERMRGLMGEDQVARVLSKVEEWYDVRLPVHLDDAGKRANISSSPN